jgi:hypothetical protein
MFTPRGSPMSSATSSDTSYYPLINTAEDNSAAEYKSSNNATSLFAAGKNTNFKKKLLAALHQQNDATQVFTVANFRQTMLDYKNKPISAFHAADGETRPVRLKMNIFMNKFDEEYCKVNGVLNQLYDDILTFTKTAVKKDVFELLNTFQKTRQKFMHSVLDIYYANDIKSLVSNEYVTVKQYEGFKQYFLALLQDQLPLFVGSDNYQKWHDLVKPPSNYKPALQ